MLYKKILFVFMSGAIFALWGCPADPNLVAPRIPADTVGSFNFVVGKDNQSKLVVIGKEGKELRPIGQPFPPDAKLISEVTLKFYQVNPCYAVICAPDVPCQTYFISPHNCPAGF